MRDLLHTRCTSLAHLSCSHTHSWFSSQKRGTPQMLLTAYYVSPATLHSVTDETTSAVAVVLSMSGTILVHLISNC
ncbi:unnamed protein product [Dicrocoelium dendriticum]|nr:unnamed protein product [Dicrocoelium dendriticum]